MSEAREIWTIGHWTCPEAVFLRPLRLAGIELLADVRSLPGSAKSPQFNGDAMPGWLGEQGIGYVHLPPLTGRRRKQPIEPWVNGGWENRSFHNYADWTLSSEYADGLDELESLATDRRTVLLCGEPMPWRCHRSLIASTLVARGWVVTHLSTTSAPTRHQLGRWGAQPVVDDAGHVTYPARG